MKPYSGFTLVGVVAFLNQSADKICFPCQLPFRKVNKPNRAISYPLINIPPPKCPPPLTDCTNFPSNTIHEFWYPVQVQELEAPIGFIMFSRNTSGKD